VQAQPQTWHYGLIAKWWSEFNEDGPEIDYFRKWVERCGQPALDVACGTGRLLLPYLRAGLDVDGCDVSADMIELCREKAVREGLSPRLYVQPMHELDLPRKYKTIFVCGAFGLGSTRDRDLEALECFYEYLEPDGTLVLDNEVPYADRKQWPYWPKDERRSLPEAKEPPRRRRRAADGGEYALRSRIVELDPLEQTVTLAMHAEMWRDDELQLEEDHTLTISLYFKNELLLMLERAGFGEIVVYGDHNELDPTGDDDFLVFVAKKTRVTARTPARTI
jgi:SAM-dependent methyltransferase